MYMLMDVNIKGASVFKELALFNCSSGVKLDIYWPVMVTVLSVELDIYWLLTLRGCLHSEPVEWRRAARVKFKELNSYRMFLTRSGENFTSIKGAIIDPTVIKAFGQLRF